MWSEKYRPQHILDLVGNEIAWFAANSDYQIDGQGWFNSLPVEEAPNPTDSVKILHAFEALLHYVRMKIGLSFSDDTLITLFKNPEASNEKGGNELLRLTHWNADSLDSLLIRFGAVSGDGSADRLSLNKMVMFRRVYDSHNWIEKFAISETNTNKIRLALTEYLTNLPRSSKRAS